jgi:hypothetical protein
MQAKVKKEQLADRERKDVLTRPRLRDLPERPNVPSKVRAGACKGTHLPEVVIE